ncbi:hypothetical protein F4X86_03160 [Candidatus Saccharibacteria bacterium]|nr:hypothetical protein [Candidatus Saccharibacteria bacterium]
MQKSKNLTKLVSAAGRLGTINVSKPASIFALAAALALSLALASPVSAQEDGQLDIIYLTQGETSSPNARVSERLYTEIRLTPPAGYSFVFETVEETTIFEEAGDKIIPVYYRMVADRDDCQVGVRPERAAELSSPNVHRTNDFDVHAHDSAFANTGFLDETDGSLLVASDRLDVRHVLGRYVCAAAEVRADSSPEDPPMHAHIAGSRRITFNNIVRPLIVTEELSAVTSPYPSYPPVLENFRLTADGSRIELQIAIRDSKYLPESSDYEADAAAYWRYKLTADRGECPRTASTTERKSGFSGFQEIAAWSRLQSSTSPSAHLTVSLAESSEAVKSKHLCLETKLANQPAEYSYEPSVAIDWTRGQIPTEPTSNWQHLTSAERLAFNPYRCADKEQIDEDNGWCLDGSGLAAVGVDDVRNNGGADTGETASEPSANAAVWIVGGLILLAAVVAVTVLKSKNLTKPIPFVVIAAAVLFAAVLLFAFLGRDDGRPEGEGGTGPEAAGDPAEPIAYPMPVTEADGSIILADNIKYKVGESIDPGTYRSRLTGGYAVFDPYPDADYASYCETHNRKAVHDGKTYFEYTLVPPEGADIFCDDSHPAVPANKAISECGLRVKPVGSETERLFYVYALRDSEITISLTEDLDYIVIDTEFFDGITTGCAGDNKWYPGGIAE